MKRPLAFLLVVAALHAGCILDLEHLSGGGGAPPTGSGASTGRSVTAATTSGTSTGTSSSSSASASSSSSASTSAATTSSASTSSASSASSSGDASSPVTAAELAALAKNCKQVPGTTDFASAAGQPNNVPVCQLTGAVWWTSGMSIACDGGKKAPCTTSPGYSSMTAGTDSMGNPLDASTLPFVVMPAYPSNGWNWMTQPPLTYGSVVAVLYNGRLQYAIVGDVGDKGIIGEGSYALAYDLGIDPNPVSGGVGGGVTYIAFTGAGGEVLHNEDQAATVALGEMLAQELVANN